MLRIVTSAENVQRRRPFKIGGGSSGGGTRSLGGVLERGFSLLTNIIFNIRERAGNIMF